MKSIRHHKSLAKEQLANNKKTSAVVAAISIYSLLFISFSSDNLVYLFRRQSDIIMFIASILIVVLSAVFSLGFASYCMGIIRKGRSDINDFLSSFENLGNAILLALLKGLFTFLWSILFIVPGIIAAYNYSLAEFVMAERPDISPLEAIKISKQLMQGKKMKLFDLCLSFIGWYLLSFITFGIVGMYAIPYANLAIANFYDEAKQDYDDEMNFRAEWEARRTSRSSSSAGDKNFGDEKQEVWENSDKDNSSDNDKGKTYL